MEEAKNRGKIRHIGITNHRLSVANEAIDSGLYETLQFPFSYLAGEQDIELVKSCRKQDMGFIAMKALVRRTYQQLGGGLRLPWLVSVMSCPSGESSGRASSKNLYHMIGSPPVMDGRAQRRYQKRTGQELSGRILPRLRLLYALSCWA